MIDRYTRTVLTIIAAALVSLVVQNITKSQAQYGSTSCGLMARSPCYIATAPGDALEMHISR